MKLAYWMYAGPAHIGTLRVASSFKNVHAIMHAPLGDDYFNVMRSMLERERDFTPVTTSIVDRHVLARGSQEKVIENIKRKHNDEKPDLVVLTPTCTSSILQEDLENFVQTAKNQTQNPVILADVNHYRINEFQAADRTLEQIIRFSLESETNLKEKIQKTTKPSVNIIGIFTLGFHNHHDSRELKRLFNDLGIEINAIIPEGAFLSDLKKLPQAWFNFIPYRETGLMTAKYLEKEFDMPYIDTVPMGLVNLSQVIKLIKKILKEQIDNSCFVPYGQPKEHANESIIHPIQTDINFFETYINNQTQYISQAGWFSRTIDCQNLTGKKVFVFGDSTHAALMTQILTREMGLNVICAGTFCKHDADWFREQVQGFCAEILITEDHNEVASHIQKLEPEAIFGTQMERHIGKKLNIPCGVISAPVHIQNFPLGYRPFLGYEGTNQIADLIYNSFTLGMEDHLLEIFGGHDTKDNLAETKLSYSDVKWDSSATLELKKIPGFVRTKIKRNTEQFALKNNIIEITIDVLYRAKEELSRDY